MMTTMDNSIDVQHTARPPLVIALLIVNWGVFAFATVSCLSWWAVTFMVIPYPELMAQAGEAYSVAFSNTAVFTALAAVAGGALWLLSRRHAGQWYGQAVLLLAVIATLTWALHIF